MSTQNFIRWMIDTLSEDMNKLSHDLAGRALDQSDYLISVGKYRQMRTMVEKLKERLASTDQLPDLEDSELEPQPPRIEAVAPTRKKAAKPRPWGGGR
jgi:hypothetical protein